MILRKYAHPTVVLEENGKSLLIDPGTFTAAAPELIRAAAAVLITHEHPVHADVDLVTAALDGQPTLTVWAPASVAALLPDRPDRVRVVAPGDSGIVAGFRVAVVGGAHAIIHPDLPVSANVSYIVEENVYHPGDSYFVPDEPVRTLLVPMSGPFAHLEKIIDFIRAVTPAGCVFASAGFVGIARGGPRRRIPGVDPSTLDLGVVP
ncbi:MBL fold metallo-hydrolase [Curtobacterium sp. 1544]|jgi:L-ascorbate metabolism protein UlaG (beta-lactamase superfamily)|uniref:MBL fold metallo-hydrolase n=1 Tax=Curtobacterium sp. 1544 TaxID=3156417 RepID=UPI00339A7C95